MNTFGRPPRLAGFIATLAAGLMLSAALDGAGAVDQVREGGANPIRNTIHPIIVGRDDDQHHGRKHRHGHKNDQGNQSVCECLYPPCPTNCGPRRAEPTKSAPVSMASVSKPMLSDPGYAASPERGVGAGASEH